ncbi:transport and Golgi organization protein 2-like isoform X1 [Leguminivora glycinivorella]|uniref:transport and Golgi organization protein 2-like isoform X1 n=2 Tax=Leguminivora glycinivorella TaxID=1035111 RepID=UPI0020105D1F|nr:transport and Golgi organization protein 2-like isoform X1 [Leguminivora glycinivorella]
MQYLSSIFRHRCKLLTRLSLPNQHLPSSARMCILFSYCGDNVAESDYQLIVAENRDEYYNRSALNMSIWNDSNVVAGRDLGAPDGDGTWLAVSPQKRKLGVLLNLPYSERADAKSRGRLVTDYVQSDLSIEEYVKTKESYVKETNEFVLVTYDFSNNTKVNTYTNSTNELRTWEETCQGFSNSLPEKPLSKAVAGRSALYDICSRLNKVSMKQQLIEELLTLLKSKEQHLPDQELENRTPMYQKLSSIFVTIPEGRYGTRTHTIILLTKTGHLEIIEVSLQSPVKLENPNWKRTEFQIDL